MKKSIVSLIVVTFFAIITFAQKPQVQKKDPTGNWKFELPQAPEGYKVGSVDVGFADKKYSATMIFPDNNLKITGERVSFLNDSLRFIMYAEGQEVNVLLKITEPLKMEGKVVYSEGEIPLLLTKAIKIN